MPTMAQCISFANFCSNHRLEPGAVAELIRLKDRRISAWRRCQTGNEKDERAHDRAMQRLELCANKLGFKVSWSGLSPTLSRNGKGEIYLPF